MEFNNPQEPPSSKSTNNNQLPINIYDLFLDLPHPAQVFETSTTTTTDKAQIIDPPINYINNEIQCELYSADNITRLSQFAFPEYNDLSSDVLLEQIRHNSRGDRGGDGKLSSRGRTFGANLMKHDVYHVDFITHHHTFALVLSDGKTRVFGHVRRYLPSHVDSPMRVDIGRRRPRCMVLLTRAMGGERFYSSVLKTAEAIAIEAQVNSKGCYAKAQNPTRSFLHALFNQHATLVQNYAELRRHGLSLNFTQAPANLYPGSKSACETAKSVMEDNEDLFRITLDKVEFGLVGPRGKGRGMDNDILQFYLPFTLQPGFECLQPRESIPEDISSPIIPLLRYIGPSHFIRLLSALLCERRIILISKSVSRLSMCVRAASSVLAQGLLLWKHILIPVLPPHMLRFLSVKAPYLVGILHQYASRLGRIDGLTDALCVNLDTNELKTLSMANPRTTVPDMLKRVNRKSSESEPNAADCLARDLDEIVKADQTLWQQDEKNGSGSSHDKTSALDVSVRSLNVDRDMMRGGRNKMERKPSLLERMKHPMKKTVTNAKRAMSLEEKRQYATSVDAAVAFGKMIRSTFQGGAEDGEDGGSSSKNDQADEELDTPRYQAPSHDIDLNGVEACMVAENEGGEEDVRAALTCFFIHMFGDMGMYLSETQGTFWLDRRKFLLRKKQLGEKENCPVFIVLQKLSASSMFATHVKGRVDDMSMTARDRASIMPHHIPLFDVCSKYLSVHRLDFSLLNVRRIVAKTVLGCTRHLIVERHVATRTTALALTSDAPFDGDATLAMTELVKSCHECNTNLSVVMSVVWHRLGQTKTTSIILALRLLRNLLTEGPLTAITEGCDGASKIYDLKSFVDAKNTNQSAEVRQAADHAYEMLMDLPALFARRQRIAFTKAQELSAVSSKKRSWSDYLVSRLPLSTDGRKMHALFRPQGIISEERDYYDEGSLAQSSVAASTTPSVLALSRLRASRKEYVDENEPLYEDEYDDEDEQFFSSNQPEGLDESNEGERYPPQAGREEDYYDDEHQEGEDVFFSDEYPAPPSNPFTSYNDNGDSMDMLKSFNYAVSSHGGSCFSASHTGSIYGDESEASYDRMA